MKFAILFLISSCSLLYCQLPRPEVFGQIGAFRDGGDEGSLGSGLSVGGAATIPFSQSWAADLAVHTFKVESTIAGASTDLRSTLFLPAIIYRRGNEKARFFIGGGIGAENARTRYDFPPQRFSASSNGALVHWRAGFVANPASRMLVRFDLIMAHRYLLPNIGAAVGVGYRF